MISNFVMLKEKNMEDSSRSRLHEILHNLAEIDYVQPEDVPNIDLYMDQVLTFLNQKLGTVSEAMEEKAMTKTMINNYTKNQLLPPPQKKKYSRDHMLNLLFIYYLKNFMSMKDIKNILDPINKKYFGVDEGLSFYDIYEEMIGFESKVAKDVTKDIIKKYKMSKEAFSEEPEEEREVLQEFTFICEMAFEVFVKKMLIEQFLASREEESIEENPKEN